MPIIPLLRNQAFDPETIAAMSAALSEACQTLGLVDGRDVEPVARHIVNLAQRGVHTKDALSRGAIQGFKADLH